MKYVCLGYFDEALWNTLSKDEQDGLLDKCIAYDDQLKKNGHWGGGHALTPAATTMVIRRRGGKNVVTDGPFSETKEQIGGILILEARDLNHAVKLIEDHPGTAIGPFEIRAVDEEFEKMMETRPRK